MNNKHTAINRYKHTKQRSLRKLTALFAAVFMMFSFFSCSIAADNGSSVLTYSEIQRRILWLKDCDYSPFSVGSVWDGAYSSDYTAVYSNGARVWNWQNYESKYCQGFGRMVFDVLFQSHSTTASQINYSGADKTDDRIAWLKNNLRPGDYLTYGGHVIIIYAIDDNKLTVYDNNHGGDPSRYDRKTYFETMGWTSRKYCDQSGSTIKEQLDRNPGRAFYIVRSDAKVYDDIS